MCFFHALRLFPSSPVNDRLVDIRENSLVFLRIFNSAFHFIGFGVRLEVDHVTAVFLQGEIFLMVVWPHIVGRIENTILLQRGGGFRQPISVQCHPIEIQHTSGLQVDYPKRGSFGFLI